MHDDDVERARAIAEALDAGATQEGTGFRTSCPLCNGHNLIVTVRASRLLANCFNGCKPAEVFAAIVARGLWQDKADEITKARRIWDKGAPIAAGTPAATYLTTVRGIDLQHVNGALRAAPAVPYYENGVMTCRPPALLAQVEDVTCQFIGVQVTYLAADGSRKANLEPSRKDRGRVTGAVRLAAPRADSPLLLAEGVETGLSIMQATGFPAWACLSATGIKHAKVPQESAGELVICCDNDANGVGQDAGKIAGKRFALEGWRVRIAVPPQPDSDFNDILRQPDGAARIRELIDEAPTLDEWFAKQRKPDDESPAQPLDADAPTFSGKWIAARFGDLHKGDLRHTPKLKCWHIWTGFYWREDDRNRVQHEVGVTCCRIAELTDDGKLKQRLTSVGTILGTLKLATGDPRLTLSVEAWDRSPWLLGSPEGTIDLRTGRMRPPDPNDHISMVTAVAPAGDCPIWKQSLEEIFAGDEEIVAYVKRVIGYSLTGSTREEAVFIWVGEGGNGKDLLCETLGDAYGDYAVRMPMSTLVKTPFRDHPTEIARLRGRRLALAAETEEGARWNVARLKLLSGSNQLPARGMRQDYFDYVPRFKMIVACNSQPSLGVVDRALERRLQLLNFPITFVEEPHKPNERQINIHLKEELRAELPGILAWAIEGALEWQASGLRPPPAVQTATATYLKEFDDLTMFLEECCAVDPREDWHGYWMAQARELDAGHIRPDHQRQAGEDELFHQWQEWAKGHGRSPNSKSWLVKLLKKRCFVWRRGAGNKTFFLGLKIGTEWPPEAS
jgi:putative DNA primase/helicase